MLSSPSPSPFNAHPNAAHLHHHFLLPPPSPPPFDPSPLPPPPPHFLLDSFYSHGWENPKHHFLFTGLGVVEEDHVREPKHISQLYPSAVLSNSSVVAPVYPKLEDFLNSYSSSSSSPVYRPTDATAAAHQDDSSLMHIYDFRDIATAAAATGGFPAAAAALSVNSKSEVDESSSSMNANSSSLTNKGSLTLGVHDSTQDENCKAVSVVGGGGVGTGKRMDESFGQ